MDEQDSIGPYGNLRRLGEGGFAVVYDAIDHKTGQHVAVKVLKQLIPPVLASVRQEVEVLASIQDRGVVRVLEHDLRGSQPWFSMEKIEGKQLAEYCALSTADPHHSALIDQGEQTQIAIPHHEPSEAAAPSTPSTFRSLGASTIPPTELSRILSTVANLCVTLDMLHGRGIVHRDLKPANVMVRKDGSPVLVDFGLYIQATDGRLSLAKSTLEGGSWPYMAPEQFRHEPIDARADLYAVGCVLYELLTRRTPFLASSFSAYSKLHQEALPLPLSALVDALPPELERLVDRLLQKEREHRIGYASEVAVALFRLCGQEPPSSVRLVPPFLFPSALAGRQDILQHILRARDALDLPRGRHIRNGLLLIGGESGVGKTRLLNEFMRRLSPFRYSLMAGGCVPLAAESSEALPLAEPLYPIRRAFLSQCDQCRQDPDLARRLFGPRTPVLAPYIPDLYGIPGISAEPVPELLSTDETTRRLYMSLATTFEALCQQQPVILLLDDLQWADELTLGFLAYLIRIRFFQLNPLLILGAWRQEEPIEALRQLQEQPGVESHTLGRLNKPAVKSMIRDMLALDEVPEPFVGRLLDYSAGNPFFLAEYLRVAVAEQLIWRDAKGWKLEYSLETLEQDSGVGLSLPRALAALLERRLRALEPAQLKMVQAAAVIGRECSVDLIERLCDDNRWPFAQGLQQLMLRQILESHQPGAVRFVHDKLQETAYELISPELRRSLHRQVAEGIEHFMGRLNENGEAVDPLARNPRTRSELSWTLPPAYGALGRHWEAAGEHEKARQAYRDDIRRTVAAEQQVETARLHQAWLHLAHEQTVERLDMRMELVKLYRRIWGVTSDEYLKLTQTNLQEARLFGLRGYEGDCLTVEAELMRQRGDFSQAQTLNAEALALYQAEGSQSGIGRSLHLSALICTGRGELMQATELYEQAVRCMHALGEHSQEAHCLNNLGLVYARRGELEKANRRWLRAYELSREAADRVHEAHLLLNLCLLDYKRGDLGIAIRHTQRAIQLMQETETVRNLPISLLQLSHLLEMQGQTQDQAGLLTQVLRLEQRLDDGVGLEALATARCQIEPQLQPPPQRLHELEQRARQNLVLLRKRNNIRMIGLHLSIFSSVLLAVGPIERVLSECRAMLVESVQLLTTGREMDSAVLAVLRFALLELDHGGDLQRARQQAELATELSRQARHALFEAYSLAIRGRCALRLGEPAQRYLEEARKLLQTMDVAPTCIVRVAIEALAESLEQQVAAQG